MKERILKFLESERISPAEFADKIGVQRSSMSHILNGRNHPSAAFIQKMLHAFPNVNSRWLLIGDGKMHSESLELKDISIKSPIPNIPHHVLGNNTEFQIGSKFENRIEFAKSVPGIGEITQSGRYDDNVLKGLSAEVPSEEIKANNISTSTLSEQNLKEEQNIKTSLSNSVPQSEKKEIEQILFFYKDKTFLVYQPS